MRLRIGFLGFAHGHQYGLIWQVKPEYAEVAALADEDPERLRKALEKLGEDVKGVKVYEDYEDLLTDDEIDLVSICVENDRKPDLILKAAENGKHIVVEKPICLTLKDLEEVARVVRESEVQLSMYMSERFNPLYVALRNLIESGGIGDPVLFYAFRPHKLMPERRPDWMFQRERYGNIILDLAIHDIDYLLWVNGAEVEEVKAYMGNQRFTDRDFTDNCVVMMRFSNGAKAIVAATWLTPEAAPYHGRVRLDAVGTLGEAYLMREKNIVEVCTVREPPHRLETVETEMFLQNVVRNISVGRKPLVDLESSVTANRICLLATESAERDETIRLK